MIYNNLVGAEGLHQSFLSHLLMGVEDAEGGGEEMELIFADILEELKRLNGTLEKIADAIVGEAAGPPWFEVWDSLHGRWKRYIIRPASTSECENAQ